MKWTIQKEHDGMLIKEYLYQVRGFSRRMIKVAKFEGGKILVNGEFSTVRRVLETGNVLEVIFPPENRGAFLKPEHVPLDVLYEDEDVLVINKPAGMATIPSRHHLSGTLANGVLGYYEMRKLPYTVHIVTRLDVYTSGLVLVAKHRFSHSTLSKDQKQGLVNRRYSAIISGEMEKNKGILDGPIGRKPGSIIERIVVEGGQHATTHYQVDKVLEGYSLVDVKLETGRTHQIRVHFSHSGHALLGDDLYGGSKALIGRQALHCKSLAFTQPTTNEQLSFTCELPEDMMKLIK